MYWMGSGSGSGVPPVRAGEQPGSCAGSLALMCGSQHSSSAGTGGALCMLKQDRPCNAVALAGAPRPRNWEAVFWQQCGFSGARAELRSWHKVSPAWTGMKSLPFLSVTQNAVLEWLNGPFDQEKDFQVTWSVKKYISPIAEIFLFSPFLYLPLAKLNNWLANNFGCWKFSFFHEPIFLQNCSFLCPYHQRFSTKIFPFSLTLDGKSGSARAELLGFPFSRHKFAGS